MRIMCTERAASPLSSGPERPCPYPQTAKPPASACGSGYAAFFETWGSSFALRSHVFGCGVGGRAGTWPGMPANGDWISLDCWRAVEERPRKCPGQLRRADQGKVLTNRRALCHSAPYARTRAEPRGLRCWASVVDGRLTQRGLSRAAARSFYGRRAWRAFVLGLCVVA